MANTTHAADSSKYYVPHDSHWPITGSFALFVLMIGVIAFMNEWAGGWAFIPGAALIAYMFFGWFGTVIGENEKGMYNLEVDKSFRMGMMWFIFSEVMFFAAFFGALFYARELAVPWLGGHGVKYFTNLILWPSFENAWPTNGPGVVGGNADGKFGIIPAFGLPAINTAILLTSSVTVTIAHHALREGNRGVVKIFLGATFILGFIFVYLQAHEYAEAYAEGLQPLDGHLRFDVLHADRLPRPARDDRRHHADGDLAARDEGSLHPAASLRVRSRGLVLALRRRGVARPLHLRLLDLIESRPHGATSGSP